MSDAPLLAVRGLRKSFGGLQAVRGFDLDVAAGAIVGLIGPNGSGKTTVLNLITGEIAADGGSVRLADQEMAGLPAFRICRSQIARTFQLVRILPGMTTRENVLIGRLFGADPAPLERARRDVDVLLDRVGLADRADQTGAQLTYIDQKRVELARALATRPRLLLLDEWLAGLNPTELQIGIALIRQVRDEGVTIIMIEHVMEAIRALCDHVVVMSAGALIAAGAPDAVLADPEVARVYLGDDDA
ncbi:ABC transporter ATP-binding protein [Reyranella sp. CPCC 100927]|uniref:ABC transporter ATP-binding protein n=1 Tax=Reyranella sp. CPCC 100927 TaxID=2599616 RepID=UPI0011B464AD|nr:ABC transporter ATP-binding protein [Reyranella sp. CPCC 100927]TWT15299.1 ABC transporter ATP-binding protein [Reyranella sp. CPCC 100927]